MPLFTETNPSSTTRRSRNDNNVCARTNSRHGSASIPLALHGEFRHRVSGIVQGTLSFFWRCLWCGPADHLVFSCPSRPSRAFDTPPRMGSSIHEVPLDIEVYSGQIGPCQVLGSTISILGYEGMQPKQPSKERAAPLHPTLQFLISETHFLSQFSS